MKRNKVGEPYLFLITYHYKYNISIQVAPIWLSFKNRDPTLLIIQILTCPLKKYITTIKVIIVEN